MKAKRRILTAFILNLFFSVFEFIGGIVTGSTAIASDALHDASDALCIGIAYLMEKKSTARPDEKYTYGYGRFSVLGAFITSAFIISASALMIYRAVLRMTSPVGVDCDGVAVLAIVGLFVNLCAALITRKGKSLNEKAVSLHLLEDVLGWLITLIGAVVMRFTELTFIDPLISVGISIFIITEAAGNLRESAEVLLDKAPREVDVPTLKMRIEKLDGVTKVLSIRVRSIDGQSNIGDVRILSEKEREGIKAAVRKELGEYGISNTTVEVEN